MSMLRLFALLCSLQIAVTGCAVGEIPYEGDTRTPLSNDAEVIIIVKDEAERMLINLPEDQFTVRLLSDLPADAERIGMFKVGLSSLTMAHGYDYYRVPMKKAREVGAKGIMTESAAGNMYATLTVWAAYYWD